VWADLGRSPLANSFVAPAEARRRDPVFPLRAMVCDRCLLAQLDRIVPPEAIFNSRYAYFSSYSESWLAHCRDYADAMVRRFRLDGQSKVVEIASNDGYLLQYFAERGIPVLGIEPSANVAAAAIAKGLATEIAFFGHETAARLAARGDTADLIAAKNVLAHVPQINDFVKGVATLLEPEGVFTVEFPHLLNTLGGVQFDTIYHEHFTYLSLLAVERVFARQGLAVFDVEEVATHGGSLRVFAAHAAAGHARTTAVETVRDKERRAKLDRPAGYAGFQAKVRRVRRDLLAFLRQARDEGVAVAAYGAAAKGNTLLNYCGVTADQIAFVADKSAVKQGTLLPGSRIPVLAPEAILEARPGYILVLPWNLIDEIEAQLACAREWGGRLVTAVPRMRIV
jgi:2-polyprenyl-3-methyl-5-hydroxy-6-metoxy-1,4-benzoquinol methylase